jgi:FkbM family methyltransferase
MSTIKSILKKVMPEWLLVQLKLWKSKNSQNPFFAEEREMIKQRGVFLSNFVQHNDLVFDVGANEGNRVEAFLINNCKVVAVEPQKSCVAILNKKFGNKITIEPVGLGEKPGEMEMFISESSTLSTFSTEWKEKIENGRFKTVGWQNKVMVPISTLDLLIEKYGTPKFVKVDVEGFELEVFKGLTKSIPMISFEYAVPEQIKSLQQCVEVLAANNPNTTFNYCIGEILKFEESKWVNADEMKKIIESPAFVQSAFGDIYAKTN